MTSIPELSVGMKAIEFNLPASNDIEISLANYYSKNNVYLFFVREFN